MANVDRDMLLNVHGAGGGEENEDNTHEKAEQ